MIKDLRARFLIIIVVLLASLFYLMPTLLAERLPGFWKDSEFLPKKSLNLGLDLKGGMHLLVGVEYEEATKTRIDSDSLSMKEKLEKNEIAYEIIERVGDTGLKIVLPDSEHIPKIEELIIEEFGYFDEPTITTIDGKVEINCTFNVRELDEFHKNTVDRALETIRNKVDVLGLTEPEIIRQGDYDILIQLPGLKDYESAKKMIKTVAHLEFKLVDDNMENLRAALAGDIPEGRELLYYKKHDSETGIPTESEPLLLESNTLMTGEVVRKAYVAFGSRMGGSPSVSLELDTKGEKIFADITGANVGRRLAIILDGSVYSAPVIKSKITGGSAEITGYFTMEEAKELANVLEAGSLPAPITIEEERTVGPSLGSDSIRMGFTATMVGGTLVVLFMVLYYGASGFVADLAIFLNMIIILGVMSAFQATLTLPGIAGIALTIGMAVDANVLVFERIREELRLGKTPRAAIDGGYSKAFLTILDANVTTLIAALVLFQFGTGPVKGFAVTLSVGIVTSLFTAIFVSKTVFEFVASRFRIKRLSV